MAEEIKILKESEDPVQYMLAKMHEVITACTAMKARLDLMEEHLAFLLSKSPEYMELVNRIKMAGDLSSEAKGSKVS